VSWVELNPAPYVNLIVPWTSLNPYLSPPCFPISCWVGLQFFGFLS
jgi:hypothetical protein